MLTATLGLMTEGTQRRLAAIVSADVVGYSRLMGADEAGTLQRLNAHRSELIDELIEKHGGRIVKTTGDGLLLEFQSVVAAVECCVAVQEGMSNRNTGAGDEAIRFRIGVHLGDVIVEGDDIFGDGVNIAARLQEIGEADGVVISSNAHDSVEGRIEAGFVDAGEQSLKNIARPIRVWRWLSTASALADHMATCAPLPLPEKPSIAVLPFDNMSGDPEHEYFADGISEDIVTALSHMHWFTVIGRNSSFRYKGHAIDLTAVGRELGARYLLEGSVRRAANRLRITAQLIDSASGNHVWAQRYDGQLEDVFDFQDRITEQIVGAIEPKIRQAEIERTRQKRPENLSAYDLVLRAYPLAWRMDPEASAEARALLKRAIDLEPDYTEAWALTLFSYLAEGSRAGGLANIMTYREEVARVGKELATVGQNSAFAQIMLGTWRTLLIRDNKVAALKQLRAGLERNPNMAFGWGAAGLALCYAGQTKEGLAALERASRLSPFDPSLFLWKYAEAVGHFVDARYEESVSSAGEAVSLNPNWVLSYRYQAASLVHLERLDEARTACQISLGYDPNYTAAIARTMAPLRDEALERFIDGMIRAGLPE